MWRYKSIIEWPWGEAHIPANAITFTLTMIALGLLLTPPTVIFFRWYFKAWGL